MISAVVLGTGNVAKQLYTALIKSPGLELAQVVGRSQESLTYFSEVTTSNDFRNIVNADIYIIAVNDDAITSVSHSLVSKKGIVAHTSGAMEMDIIPFDNRGVFYPLQTFTANKALDFTTIPICIEANHLDSLNLLRTLGDLISENVYEISSGQRQKLHLAAVFSNNFVNHMYHVAESICLQEGLPFALLQPLIRETAEKINTMSPKEAQTGPARRNDTKSMEKHLELLKHSSQRELYELLSEAITQVYEKEL